MENILPESRFFRIHKSFIVAKEQITNWNANSVTVKNRDIPIGRTYKNDFLDRVKD
jgi:DNA-binding LytR/AlgR family response regulator